jgi:hypothetical protein
MYAVFVDGSRQYRVQEGDVVELDFREAEAGVRLEFGRAPDPAGDSNQRSVAEGPGKRGPFRAMRF